VRVVAVLAIIAGLSALGCTPKADDAASTSAPTGSTSTQGGAPSYASGSSGGPPSYASGSSVAAPKDPLADPAQAVNNPNVPASEREKMRQYMSSKTGQSGPGGPPAGYGAPSR
jgi:hypothetical protein